VLRLTSLAYRPYRYFPCYSHSVDYRNELSDCLSLLEDVMSNGRPTVIIGDMNFPCDWDNKGFMLFRVIIYFTVTSFWKVETVLRTVIIV